MIPEYNLEGDLPPGVHFATKGEFDDRFGFNPHRRGLLAGVNKLIADLRNAGCRRLYVDGSFTTTKEQPDDYDALWETAGVNPELLSRVLWDLSDNYRLAAKAYYLGDIFPAHITEASSGLTFMQFFQVNKESGNLKGIIALNI